MGLVLTPSIERQLGTSLTENPEDDVIQPAGETKFEGETYVSPAGNPDRQQQLMQMSRSENLGWGLRQTAAYGLYNFLRDEYNAAYDGPGIDPALNELENLERTRDPSNRALGKAVMNLFTSDYDPDYDKMEHADELLKDLPREYHDDIMAWDNLEGAQRARARALRQQGDHQLASQQTRGSFLRFIGSVPDLDAPLMMFSGGAYGAAKAARVAVQQARKLGFSVQNSARLGNLAQNALGGAQAGAVVGAVDANVREGGGLDDFIMSTVMGTGLGGGMSLLGRTPQVDEAISALRKDVIDQTAKDGPLVKDQDPDIDVENMEDFSGASVREQQRLDLEAENNTITMTQDQLDDLKITPEQHYMLEEAGLPPLVLTQDAAVPYKLTPDQQTALKLTPEQKVIVDDAVAAKEAPEAQGITIHPKVLDAYEKSVKADAANSEDYGNATTKRVATRAANRLSKMIKEHHPDLDMQQNIKLRTQLQDGVAPADMDLSIEGGGSTAGASQIINPADIAPASPLDNSVDRVSPTTRQWSDMANRSNHESGFYAFKEEQKDGFWWKLGNSSWTSGIGSGLQGRMLTSNSPIMNWMATNITESANGFGRGLSTASTLVENYQKRIQTQFLPYHTGLHDWAKKNGKAHVSLFPTREGSAEFNRLVRLERNNRKFDRPLTDDPNVRLAADGLDNAALEAHRVAKGKDGQMSVDGFENVKVDPHYNPLGWSGSDLLRLTKGSAPRTTEELIIKGMARAYKNAGIVGRDVEAIARAVLNRAKAGEEGMDTSLANMLTKDGQEFMRAGLRADGVSEEAINGIMRRLTQKRSSKSREGFTKRRNDIDLGETIEVIDGGEPLQIVDLLTDDLHGEWQRYTRHVAGAGALARKGITNRSQRTELITALQAEQRALGEEVTDARELQAMFTAWDGGAVKGWSALDGGDIREAGPIVGSIKRLVNLAWLNKLGLTQVGETGATISQNGIANWWRHGPMRAWDKGMKENGQQMLDELAYITGQIGLDHKFFAEHLNLDEMSKLDKADYMSKLQKLTSLPSYIQGYTSGFNTVRTMQQQTAALGMANKVFMTLKKASESGEGVLQGMSQRDRDRFFGDFGINESMINQFEVLIENGTIEFDPTGKFVNKMNMKDWDIELAEDFGSAVTRNVNQVVQKSMAGELDTWMHTGWGSMMTHLKTFPMQAMQKQLVRNFRHGATDKQAMNAVIFGFGTAMVASYVRSGISIGDQEMGIEDHAKRAFSYGNMTGFLPMVHDPMMTIMGLDDYRFNQFGERHEINPPALSYANDLMRLPAALRNVASGEAGAADRASLRTIPFGNTFIFGDIMNNLGQKQDD